MDKLINVANSTGKYNESTIELTSEVVVVNLASGLSITKSADKSVWTDGFLTYTIKLKNETSLSYESPIITDTLDSLLITLVEGSVTINGIPADPTKYSFRSGTIKIMLDDVEPNSETVVKFKVAQI